MSEHLTTSQCRKLIAAASLAELTGLDFNRHWAVHYERAGIDDRDGAQFVGHLLKLVKAWVRRNHGNFAAIWVRENGDGKGAHLHILMHLPAGLSLRNRTRRWIELGGGSYRKGVSKVRVIGGSLASASRDSERHHINVEKVLAYLMKGADSEVGSDLGLVRYSEGGRVIGKRCGWTQTVGKLAARRE